jgi:hypothetical protein
MSEPTPEWTVAVYLAGGNALTEPMVRALQEMREVNRARPKSLRVLAQFEPGRKLPRMFAFDDAVAASAVRVLTPPPRPTKRVPTLSSHELIVDDPEASHGGPSSVERLRRFVAAAQSVAAGGRFLLVVSGHGNGAVGEFLGCRETDYALSLADLPRTFASCTAPEGKIDVIGMDCCNMSMVEVAFELAPFARYLVASEGSIRSYGWPYREILTALEGLEPERAARRIAAEFVRFYSDYTLLDVPSHCAVTNLERMASIVAPLRRLAERLLASIHEPATWRPAVLAHWEAQSYKDEEYVDLADFCDRLRRIVEDPELRKCCADVIRAVDDVVTVSHASGAAFQYSTGLSIYFPWCNDVVKARGESRAVSVLEKYKALAFSRETLWGEFLDEYLTATRREPRREAVEQPIQILEPVTV